MVISGDNQLIRINYLKRSTPPICYDPWERIVGPYALAAAENKLTAFGVEISVTNLSDSFVNGPQIVEDSVVVIKKGDMPLPLFKKMIKKISEQNGNAKPIQACACVDAFTDDIFWK
jgi:hypothetical protein